MKPLDATTRALLRQAISEARRDRAQAAERGCVCEECSGDFVANASHQKFCSTACRQRVYARRKAEQRRKRRLTAKRHKRWRLRHKTVKVNGRWVARDKEIVRRWEDGERQNVLAEAFDLHPDTIRKILDREIPGRPLHRFTRCRKGHTGLVPKRRADGRMIRYCGECHRQRQYRYLENNPTAREKKRAADRRYHARSKQREAA